MSVNYLVFPLEFTSLPPNEGAVQRSDTHLWSCIFLNGCSKEHKLRRNETGDYKDWKAFATYQASDIKRVGKEKEELEQGPEHARNHYFLMGWKCLKWECRTGQARSGSNTVLGKSGSRLRSHWIRSWLWPQHWKAGFPWAWFTGVCILSSFWRRLMYRN